MARGVKTGGRQKGTENKVTKDLRLLIKDLLTKELSQVEEQFKWVEAKDRLDFIIKLIPYAIPKVEQVAEEGNSFNNQVNFFENIKKQIKERSKNRLDMETTSS